MNNKHIQELTLRLSQALDQNYDVINMDAVISVISALEGTTITKEQLETTRLAKYINQLRRRTRSEQLARRAKSLLKKWREMVGIQQQQQPQTQQSIPYVNTITPSAIQKNLISVRDSGGKYHQQHLTVTSSVSSSNVITSSSNCSTTVFCSQLSNNIINPISNSNISTLSANSTKKNHNNYSINYINSKRFDMNKSMPAIQNGEMLIEKYEGISSEKYEEKNKKKSEEPPTSFEHIFNAFSTSENNTNVNKNNTISGEALDNYKSSPLLQKKQQYNQFGTVIEKSTSNSNETFSLLETSAQSQIDTIVIDIQDSNSGSNVIPPTTSLKNQDIHSKNSSKCTFNSFTSRINRISPLMINKSDTLKPSFSTNFNSHNTGNIITKRIKKDKKCLKDKIRLEENDEEITTLDEHSSLDQSQISTSATILVANEETSDQNSSMKVKENNFFHNLLRDKDTVDAPSMCYPVISNISEILSLSNSSMNSMFPNNFISTGASTIIDDKFVKVQKASAITVNEKNIDNSSDPSNFLLSFAGKFNRNKGQETFLDNFSSQLPRNNDSNNMEKNTFCENSNDSVSSHSRISQFDVNDNNGNENLIKTANSVCNLSSIPLANVNNNSLENPQMYLNTLHHSNANINLKEKNVEKIPKKRGRKKGSRGVDSVIAKEASLTSQMLISSLGLGVKKVKTTKEIYTEMQNRKLVLNVSTPSAILSTSIVNTSNNATGSFQQQPFNSRPTSSCSELSLYSPCTMDGNNTTMCSGSTLHVRGTPDNYVIHSSTVGLDSESDTTTSGEPSKDSLITSGNSGSQKMLRCTRGMSIDSNSNTCLVQQLNGTTLSSVLGEGKLKRDLKEKLDTTKKQLNELLTQFQCVPCINKIEFDCYQDWVPCTCKVIEIPLKEKNTLQLEVKRKHNDSGDNELKSPGNLSRKRQLEFNSAQNENIKIAASSSNVTLSSATLLSTKISTVTETAQMQKPKKSIFDLDFEDHEDPLHKILAEATALQHSPLIKLSQSNEQQPEQHYNSNILNTKNDLNNVKIAQFCEVQPHINEQQTQYLTNSILIGGGTLSNDKCIIPLPLPIYEIEEDLNCLAKQRFALQTQNITEFHVNALHNCYIANVNGNWDYSYYNKHPIIVIQDFKTNTRKSKSDFKNIISKFSNVVPKYGSLIRGDRIRKDLRHVAFTQSFDYKCKSRNFFNKWQTPFLGVVVREKEEKQENSNDYKVKQKKNELSIQGKCKYKIYTQDKNDAMIISLDSNEIRSENNRLKTNLSILKGITIDINSKAEIANEKCFFKPSSINEIVGNNNNIECNNNLLAIVNTNKSTSSNCVNNSFSWTNDTNLKSFVPLEQFKCVTNPCSNMEMSSIIASNFSRRISNLGSNSKLKQHSHNQTLKENCLLRRDARLQKTTTATSADNIENRKRKREKEKNHSSNKNPVINNKKPRLTKRLKIALNGDVEMISLDSVYDTNSTNNTDDESNPNLHNTEYVNTDTSTGNVHLYTNTIVDEPKYNSDCNTDTEDRKNVLLLKKQKRRNKFSHNNRGVNNNDNNDKEVGKSKSDSEYDNIKYINKTYSELDSNNKYDKEYTYTSDCHGIKTHNISATTITTGNKHIVLTIRKTPSKTNSPTSTLSLPMIPPINTDAKSNTSIPNMIDPTAAIAENTNVLLQTGESEQSVLIDKNNIDLLTRFQKNAAFTPIFNNTILRTMRNWNRRRKVRQLNLSGSSDDHVSKSGCTKDNKERKRQNNKGTSHMSQKILNISSCSSSFEGNSDVDYEYYSSDSNNIMYINNPKVVEIQNQDSIDVSSNSQLKTVMGLSNDNIDIESKNCIESKEKKPDYLPIENNGMLVSFNNIEIMGLHRRNDGQDLPRTGHNTNDKSGKHKANEHGNNRNPDFIKIENQLEIFSNNNFCDDAHLYDSSINSSNLSFADYKNRIYNIHQQLHKEQSATISTNNFNSEFKDQKILSFADSTNSYNNSKISYNEYFISKNNNDYDTNTNSENNKSINTNNNNNVPTIAKNFAMYNNNNINNANFTLATNNAMNSTLVNQLITKSQQTLANEDELINSNIGNNNKASNLQTKDYRTGQRNVDADVIDNDGSSNCTRIQLFKEWHEMLQLQSYNNDLLTVLPYVVLE